MWAFVWKPKGREGKWDKLPFDPKARRAASTSDSKTWGTFAEAATAYGNGNCDGIGFVFTDDDPYVGIDLDGCRDPETGVIESWARDIVHEAATYCEVSPSGLGVKLVGTGVLPPGAGHRFRGGQIEIYASRRYFTITGCVVRLEGQNDRNL